MYYIFFRKNKFKKRNQIWSIKSSSFGLKIFIVKVAADAAAIKKVAASNKKKRSNKFAEEKFWPLSIYLSPPSFVPALIRLIRTHFGRIR